MAMKSSYTTRWDTIGRSSGNGATAAEALIVTLLPLVYGKGRAFQIVMQRDTLI